MCVRAYVCARVCVCVRVCVRACVRACVCGFYALIVDLKLVADSQPYYVHIINSNHHIHTCHCDGSSTWTVNRSHKG